MAPSTYVHALFVTSVHILICNGLQTVAEVMAFDRDRVASMIVRDVSRTKRAPN